MKRFLCVLLACLICMGMLSGCSKEEQPSDLQNGQGSFEPETTAVAGGLTQAIEEAQDALVQDAPQGDVSPVQAADESVSAESAVPDAEPSSGQEPAADQPAVMDVPAAEPVNNSHNSITGYSTVGDLGLEFSFSYPANWNNLPGRSTVCYVQPMTEGVAYPARVSVTMKKLSHRCTSSKLKDQFASFFKFISSQYDEETFEANMALNTKTKFMGKNALSTTYLAYDGEQEIKGYAITTYFERYVFVFHFLCAYENYKDFEPAMQFMRDSVRTELKFEDD